MDTALKVKALRSDALFIPGEWLYRPVFEQKLASFLEVKEMTHARVGKVNELLADLLEVGESSVRRLRLGKAITGDAVSLMGDDALAPSDLFINKLTHFIFTDTSPLALGASKVIPSSKFPRDRKEAKQKREEEMRKKREEKAEAEASKKPTTSDFLVTDAQPDALKVHELPEPVIPPVVKAPVHRALPLTFMDEIPAGMLVPPSVAQALHTGLGEVILSIQELLALNNVPPPLAAEIQRIGMKTLVERNKLTPYVPKTSR